MRSREELLAACARGATHQFLFFWGHRPAAHGAITKSWFSQWIAAPFTCDGVSYPTAEHFMMASKAELFGAEAKRVAILSATTAERAKALGRQVAGFDEGRRQQQRWDIVVSVLNLLGFALMEVRSLPSTRAAASQ